MTSSDSGLFQKRARFARSAQLERDWHDATALQGYVLTDHARAAVGRLAQGLAPQSGARAWRITGDYGSGKSSFALLLAHLFSERRDDLPRNLRRVMLQQGKGSTRPHLLPVLVTGSREPLAVALLRALSTSLLASAGGNGAQVLAVLNKVQATLARKEPLPSDVEVLELVGEAQAAIVQSGHAEGMLLILDEMGKFLEFAAMYPDRQDIFLLQGLAEAAMRSGPSPLFIVGLLHQGFSAYADNLAPLGQREWEKVAGRFEELAWNHPVEQVALLVVEAMGVKVERVPPELCQAAERDMEAALALHWYGTAPPQVLKEVAARLFPLHPTVLPPLVRLFARFGQNERSLFTFLLGDEPFGLRDFVARTGGREFFGLSHLFDYARGAFGHRLSLQSYRTHWHALESVVATYTGNDPLELHLLKSVALLNTLNAGELLARQPILEVALRGVASDAATSEAIRRLKARHVLYGRGMDGGYSLWPHTSVNLDRVHEDARRALGTLTRVAPHLRDQLETRPLVARRHYIQTGNLRHFDVIHCAVDELEAQLKAPSPSDGRILVPLCETPEEQRQALEFAQSGTLRKRDEVLVAVPRPLQGLAGVVNDVRLWAYIERNTPELKDDPYALEEVSRQLTGARQLLNDSLQNTLGLAHTITTAAGGESGLRWFHRGVAQENMGHGRAVLERLSVLCDERFNLSPRIQNELINRRVLSSAAAGARMRLIERLFSSPDQPLLGLDESKKPPEMSMYLSVMKAAQLHRRDQAGSERWQVTLPAEADDREGCRVLPALRRIHQVLAQGGEQRVFVTQVLDALQQAPYGVRDGLSPLLLAVFAVVYEPELAFYEDGTFLPRLDGDIFLRLTKAPETFQIQLCPLTGVRSELFHRLIHTLELSQQKRQDTRVDVLDVIKPLLTFVVGLPEYTLKTSRLKPDTLAVREALKGAQEPATLLWRDLPLACGLPPFDEDSPLGQPEIEEFAQALKSAVDELRGAYPMLLHWLQLKLQSEFGLDCSFETMQATLAPRARRLQATVTEARLRSFCLRLADTKMAEDSWLESLGSMMCAQPPNKWRDLHVHRYESDIHALCAQFARVEATDFGRWGGSKAGYLDAEVLRVALTQPDGHECQSVVWVTPLERENMASVEDQVIALLNQHGRIGVAATMRALWHTLQDEEETP